MIEVEKFITYKEAAKLEAEGRGTIGGLGGFFEDGMRWKDYVEMFYPKGKEYADALRRYIVKNNIKRGGDWHQSEAEGAPLFTDGNVACFSFRAWGDILAAIWATEENRDYSYMSFYMDSYIPKDDKK